MQTDRRRSTALIAGSALALLGLGAQSAEAVNADHGNQVVSVNPVLARHTS